MSRKDCTFWRVTGIDRAGPAPHVIYVHHAVTFLSIMYYIVMSDVDCKIYAIRYFILLCVYKKFTITYTYILIRLSCNHRSAAVLRTCIYQIVSYKLHKNTLNAYTANSGVSPVPAIPTYIVYLRRTKSFTELTFYCAAAAVRTYSMCIL